LAIGSAAKLEVGKQPRDAPYESSEMKLDNGGVNMGDDKEFVNEIDKVRNA
jgi:hypothetical protein